MGVGITVETICIWDDTAGVGARLSVAVGAGEECVGKIPCELSWIVMATEEWVWFAMVMDGVAIERDGVIVGIGEPCVGKIPCELSWIVMATEEWVWFAMVMDEVAIERDGVIVGIGEPS